MPIIWAGETTAGYTLRQVTKIAASTTYTVPANVSALYVVCIGGGGQGGGTPATAGAGNGQCVAAGGGGGGGYAASFLTGLAASYTVTVGAGGSTGTAGQAGQAGADTIFGSNVVVAKGGGGGPIGVVDVGVFPDTSGAGGQATNGNVGDFTVLGGNGSGGFMFRVAYPQAGVGGAAPSMGLSALTGPNNGTFAGNAGWAIGSGGTGSCAKTSGAALAGGAGVIGVVLVYEYRNG